MENLLTKEKEAQTTTDFTITIDNSTQDGDQEVRKLKSILSDPAFDVGNYSKVTTDHNSSGPSFTGIIFSTDFSVKPTDSQITITLESSEGLGAEISNICFSSTSNTITIDENYSDSPLTIPLQPGLQNGWTEEFTLTFDCTIDGTSYTCKIDPTMKVNN